MTKRNPLASEKWQPYRHAMPKESPPDLVIPSVLPSDERVWVPLEENVWFRPLCLSAAQGYWMNSACSQGGCAIPPPSSSTSAWLCAKGTLALLGTRLDC